MPRITQKMSPRKKTHGVGAVVSSLMKFLHPSALIREKFPNPVHGQQLEGCQTVRQEVKTINRKDQLSLVVTHQDFKDGNGDLQELHAVKKHFAVQEEGDPDYFFDVSQEAQEQQQADLLPAVIDSEIQGKNMGGHQIYLPLCQVLSTSMMTTNQHLRMYQLRLQHHLSSPMNGDIWVFVRASNKALQIPKQNLSTLSTQPGMTSIYNCLSVYSPSS